MFPNSVAALLRTAKDRLASLLSSAHDKKRAVIVLDADAEQVSIIAMFYGGQDYETILQGDSEYGQECTERASLACFVVRFPRGKSGCQGQEQCQRRVGQSDKSMMPVEGLCSLVLGVYHQGISGDLRASGTVERIGQ